MRSRLEWAIQMLGSQGAGLVQAECARHRSSPNSVRAPWPQRIRSDRGVGAYCEVKRRPTARPVLQNRLGNLPIVRSVRGRGKYQIVVGAANGPHVHPSRLESSGTLFSGGIPVAPILPIGIDITVWLVNLLLAYVDVIPC